MSKLNFISREKVLKGWSGDDKFCATTEEGTKYLLRVTSKNKCSNREEMFRLQQQVAFLGVSISKPVEFGFCDEHVYSIETWVDGQDAEDVIPYLNDADQYSHGLDAGKTLKVIHSIPAPENQQDWEQRFNNKIDYKIKKYNECSIKFEGAEYILAYIKANRHLLKNRPQSFQHGDYHIGNMMVEDNKLVIIDFDRFDYGDPWEEFNRIVFCAQASPIFASGIIDGYFNHQVPLDFWKLLALYISSNALSAIAWAIPYGDREINTMLNQAKDVLSWYNNFHNFIPT